MTTPAPPLRPPDTAAASRSRRPAGALPRGPAAGRRPRPGRSRLRRLGGVLVLVAGGMAVLLLVAGMAVDVNLWYLDQSRLEYATRAAAAAGYERLKDLDFNYRNPRTRRSVDGTVREYLELNGATVEESAAAQISVSKRNEVTVTVNRVSATILAKLGGIHEVRLRSRGSLAHTNNIAPFAIPSHYQDPDRDLMANFDHRSGRIEARAVFEPGKPYVVKYGKPIFSTFDDFVLIPMDSVEAIIPPEAFANIQVPTTVPGKFVVHDQGVRIPAQHIDPSNAYQVGVFRAYGIAYAVLGLGQVENESATLQWMMGLAGGSFLVKRKFLRAAGYYLQEIDSGYGVILDAEGKPTNTVAMLLELSDRGSRNYPRDFALFRYLTDELPRMDPAPVQVIELSEQPQVITFTGSADPVTRVMDFARIPYVAVSDQWDPRLHLDPSSSCVDSYRIQDRYPKAFRSPKRFRAFLESAPNALATLEKQGKLRLGDKPDGALRTRGFDWVHIHHEDFTHAGKFPNELRAMTVGLRDWVRRGHHHLFAACLAIESFEIFLAAADFGEEPTGLFPEMLDFGSTLAFTDFEIDKTRGGHRSLGAYASSQIDGERSEARKGKGQGLEARWFLTDYLNPRCQNHDGAGGVRLDLNQYPPRLTKAVDDPARKMVAPEGATNTMLVDYIKPFHVGSHDGYRIPSLSKPCMVLGAVGDPTVGPGRWSGRHVRYLTGVADDDDDLENGHGQFTFLGGHRPADPGGFTRVGTLTEGLYYDDNDVWVPEVLHEKGGGTLKFDFDGDGAAKSVVEIVRLGKNDAKPRTLSPAPDATQGWPTWTPEMGAAAAEAAAAEAAAATTAAADPSVATTSTPPGGATTGSAGAAAATTQPTVDLTPFPASKFPRISWNDEAARWVERTGRDNFVSLHESSAVVIHDINNDGDSDDSFVGDLYEVGKPNVPGYRLYLNNILYGSVSIAGERRSKLNLGAINPAQLGLGESPGSFGFLDAQGAGGSLREILQYGYTVRGGLPLGKEFQTAPGIFSEQIDKAMEFNFRDASGKVDSVPWHLSEGGKKAGPTQVKVVPVIERLDDPGKSFYHGYEPLDVRVVGFAKFFMIDLSIDDATLTEDPEDPSYMGGPPLEGEVRGYFLEWVIEPEGAQDP